MKFRCYDPRRQRMCHAHAVPSEQQIDVLAEAKKMFGMSNSVIAYRAELTPNVVSSVLTKWRYATMQEYSAIYSVMIDLALEAMKLTKQEAMERIRLMKEREQQKAYNNGESPQRK